MSAEEVNPFDRALIAIDALLTRDRTVGLSEIEKVQLQTLLDAYGDGRGPQLSS